MSKTMERAKARARIFSMEENRDELNYWRKAYNRWRESLSYRNKAGMRKDIPLRGINLARTELRVSMRALEIQLGRAQA